LENPHKLPKGENGAKVPVYHVKGHRIDTFNVGYLVVMTLVFSLFTPMLIFAYKWWVYELGQALDFVAGVG